MSSIKKELYNHSFEHVVKQFEIAEKSFDVESKKLSRAAKEIYVAAQIADRNGDEELAYIFYMRYITIIQALQKKSDFRGQQAELTALYGGEDCFLNALNAAEVLQKSLIARFKERDNPKRSSHADSKILPSVTDQKKELQQKLDDKSNELEQLKLKYDRLQQQFKAEQAAHEQYRMDVESTMNAEIEKRIAEKEAKENEQRAKRQK